MTTPKICIIGAGSSGITAAKTLFERGIAYDCYEKGSGIGGNWRYMNDNGMSSAYRNLHINTSKTRMAYSDYPMPDDYPDYPHHSLMLQYFENYVDHFGFRHTITFNTGVEHVAPSSDNSGGYKVSLSDGRRLHYDVVLVANGHHWSPRYPEPPFPGIETFPGKQLHAHHYKVPEDFTGQNVVIVGFGNSAIDMACDTAHLTQNTYIAARRSVHIIPKYMFGIPSDLLTNTPLVWSPLWMQRFGMQLLVRLARGSQRGYGVPVPKHPILSEHPTISSDLLHYVGHGRVKIKPNIQRIDGKTVIFADGSRVEADSLIYATGYNLCFPFFAPEFIKVEHNRFPLYQMMVHPQHLNLYFIGFVQPLGAVMPLAEWQSKWVAALIRGECRLPDQATMQRSIDERQRKMARRYYQSDRHTIQVDFKPYVRAIQLEMARK